MTHDDLRRRVEEAQSRIRAWPGKDKDLANLIPREGLCSLCYLSGRVPHPNHDLILLCPHPSAMLLPFSWKEGRLVAGPGYMADKSAFVDMLRAVAERYAGVNPEATNRWMRLHNAAQDLLDACELAIVALSGFGDEEEALRALRAAVAEAKES